LICDVILAQENHGSRLWRAYKSPQAFPAGLVLQFLCVFCTFTLQRAIVIIFNLPNFF
jgi:hypothetical protein